MGEIHTPVMLERIVELLAPALAEPGAVCIDCTLGLGGHTEAILRACPEATVIGIDRDPNALRLAAERLRPFGVRLLPPLASTVAGDAPLPSPPDAPLSSPGTAPLSSPDPARARFIGVRAVYDQIPEIVAAAGLTGVQAVLMDLGLSSLQIDRTERGFAYATDAPLDMRMDPDQALTAADIVNTYAAPELTRILSRYGEERFSQRIAQRIVAAREQEPFTDSARLVEVIAGAIPAAARHTGGHPAKRTFQALRIEVNRELEALERAVPAALAALTLGGRIAVLAYHSLEDRLVKQTLRAAAESRAPRGLPVVPAGYGPEFELLTRGAEKPGADEIAHNPRAASARLRAAERIEESR
ncbi:16S rRNA (cytosine(1402)-N(4))-methyltransferase RsmH [Granulicoccus phenolivorans]|uniref:16S rRNA (cytosine(1402)-N(4))-methyltransferase RsmH n=1 Tax=Granulicoccus phenolivorans TaxID=266854 RepID=UPI0004007565|nr:16S rRNA (cytosine(1402)-N(4))-methyltransferase RsmH [Granulicoccus phenolivorans]